MKYILKIPLFFSIAFQILATSAFFNATLNVMAKA